MRSRATTSFETALADISAVQGPIESARIRIDPSTSWGTLAPLLAELYRAGVTYVNVSPYRRDDPRARCPGPLTFAATLNDGIPWRRQRPWLTVPHGAARNITLTNVRSASPRAKEVGNALMPRFAACARMFPDASGPFRWRIGDTGPALARGNDALLGCLAETSRWVDYPGRQEDMGIELEIHVGDAPAR